MTPAFRLDNYCSPPWRGAGARGIRRARRGTESSGPPGSVRPSVDHQTQHAQYELRLLLPSRVSVRPSQEGLVLPHVVKTNVK